MRLWAPCPSDGASRREQQYGEDVFHAQIERLAGGSVNGGATWFFLDERGEAQGGHRRAGGGSQAGVT